MSVPPMTSSFIAEARARVDALPVDTRAKDFGVHIASALMSGDATCVAILGDTQTGKTQATMVARAVIDPEGDSSLFTTATILNNNATLSDRHRSVRWQTWSDVMRLKDKGEPPKVVIIDEVDHRTCPNEPRDLEMAAARNLLAAWRDAGTRFIILGHARSESIDAWASWLARGDFAVCWSGGSKPSLERVRLTLEPNLAPTASDNPVAAHNAIGAADRELMYVPAGNAPFLRAETWAPPKEQVSFGWEGSAARNREKEIAELEEAKSTYEALAAEPLVYHVPEDERWTAERALVLAYGEPFRQHIRARGALAYNEGLDMGLAMFDPVENAAFFLNRFARDGERGAKIFFDEQGEILRVEQKSMLGPFKNAGEYFLHCFR
jgi:hypothetical protein